MASNAVPAMTGIQRVGVVALTLDKVGRIGARTPGSSGTDELIGCAYGSLPRT
jgi:hypothetical protein